MHYPSSTMASSPTNDMIVLSHLYPQQGIQSDISHQTGVVQPASSPLRGFLKREPAVLGTVQIMTGMVIFMLGIVSAFVGMVSSYFGIMIWGAIIYITAGSLTVKASKQLNRCLSSVWGMTGVLLVLSVLQFSVSLSVSAFACEATCSNTEQVIYISSQVPPSIPSSHRPTLPVNTSETPFYPTSVGPPAHLSRADDWRNGKPEDPPPEYTATRN
ncbi:membrane-spanning 4-domains subfamily A member 4D-like isoform X3 [Sardina pilchardus]|uniref:membrane-spanning 4-domains subfamily A member 4D-like isoform X3 n=1 Tax=Sardina pilchardus TaxID=27697 RepID=UPI002E1027F9